MDDPTLKGILEDSSERESVRIFASQAFVEFVRQLHADLKRLEAKWAEQAAPNASRIPSQRLSKTNRTR